MKDSDRSAADDSPVSTVEYDSDDGLSLIGLLNTFLRHWKLLVVFALLGAGAGVAIAMSEPPVYTANSVVMPQEGGSEGSRFSGIAAQIGIDMSGGGGSVESVAFYAELLTSREILREAVLRDYEVSVDGRVVSGNLIELYGIPSERPKDARVRAAMARLARSVDPLPDSRLGVLELRTTAPWPELAEELNRELLLRLNEFNVQRRQSRARTEREFVQTQLEEAAQSLRAAEEEMQRFLQQNRNYQQSPQLMFEAGRYERRIQFAQQVYASLAQSYEQAKIDEVRNTPVVTIVERPEGSVQVLRANRIRNGLIGMVLALVLATLVVLTRELFLQQRRSRPEEYKEFVELRRSLARDLTPHRWSGRLRSRANGAE